MISVSCVFRLSFFCESSESFLAISCPQHSFIVESFNLQSWFQVNLCAPIYSFLCVLYGNRSISWHFFYNAQCFFLSLSECICNMIHKAKFQCIFSFDSSSCKNELFSLRNTNSPSESLSSSSSRNQTPVCFRKTHFGTLCSNSNISIESQLQSSSKCRSIDQTKDRTMNVSEIIKNPPEIKDNSFNFVFRFIESFFKISSGTKMTLDTTSQNTSSKLMLRINFFDCIIKLNMTQSTWFSKSTERAFLNLGLSSSNLATLSKGAS